MFCSNTIRLGVYAWGILTLGVPVCVDTVRYGTTNYNDFVLIDREGAAEVLACVREGTS